jgi:hypothetical protein
VAVCITKSLECAGVSPLVVSYRATRKASHVRVDHLLANVFVISLVWLLSTVTRGQE